MKMSKSSEGQNVSKILHRYKSSLNHFFAILIEIYYYSNKIIKFSFHLTFYESIKNKNTAKPWASVNTLS